jgi:hypothetical protein
MNGVIDRVLMHELRNLVASPGMSPRNCLGRCFPFEPLHEAEHTRRLVGEEFFYDIRMGGDERLQVLPKEDLNPKSSFALPLSRAFALQKL